MKLYLTLALTLTLPLALLLAACGSRNAPAPDAPPAPTPSTSAEVAPPSTPTAAAPTATALPTSTPSPAPTPTLVVPQWLPTAVPKQSAPRPEPTPLPTAAPRTEPTTQPAPQFPFPTESDAPAAPRFQHHAALMDDGRIIITDGFTGVANNNLIVPFPLFDIQIYDPASGSWLWIAPQDEQAAMLMTTTLKLSAGKYISVGLGGIDDELAGTAAVFDTEAQSWTPLPPLAAIRGIPKAALLQDGRVLVIGGLDFSNPDGFQFTPLNSAEIFDPRTEEWQSASDMTNASENQAIAPLQDGRIMVMSGGIPGAEIYDPATDSWTPTSEPADHWTPLTPVAAALPDGKVLVTGGWSADEFEGIDESMQIAQTYNPATDTWEATQPLNQPRLSHTLTVLPDGRLLAAGGIDIESQDAFTTTPRATTEIFDPATNEWLPGPDMAEPRYDHTATLLSDGRLFLFGGVTLREDISEIYPTDTGEFITLPSADN